MAAELKINCYPVCFLCDLNYDEKFRSSIQVFEIRLSRLVISYGIRHTKSDPHHLDEKSFENQRKTLTSKLGTGKIGVILGETLAFSDTTSVHNYQRCPLN